MNTILPITQDSFLATDETWTEHGFGTKPEELHCFFLNPCLFRVSSVANLLLCCAALLSVSSARADDITPGESAEAHIVLKPDAQVPLDLKFRDEAGKTVKLGDYFHPNRPVVLTMVYFGCKALCGSALNGLTDALRKVGLQPGGQFEIVTVSFNPAEGPEMAAGKKENYVTSLGKPEFVPAWHFLTSSDLSAAKALGDAIGFGYRRTPKGDYLHDAGIYVCTPEGRVSRVQQGVLFDPVELHDSLINASQGKISTGLFGAGLSCGLFNFDAATGKYAFAAVAIMRITAIVTVLAVAGGIAWIVYWENRRKMTTSAEPAIQQP
jgi:protein SCO1/2